LIKNLIKHFYQENLLAKAVILLLFFSFSCSDNGCIDADDFGEFESQTLEVTANSSQSDCKYDLTKPLDDTEAQGERVKICFISGKKTVTNENGETQEVSANASPAGCMGFNDAEFRNLCVSQCVQECAMTSISNSPEAEPDWVSTTKRSTSVNDGVTISPGSQIIINATGNISLGDSATYPSIYVQANKYIPHTSKNDWSDLIFDVRPNQSLDLRFSGKWKSGSNDEYGTKNTGITNAGNGPNDIKIYNGAKRIAAFVIPHPTGYSLNPSQTDEKLAVKGVPLLPDRSVWSCSYTNQPSGADATCEGKEYVAAGYSEVSNNLAESTFPISAEVETFILGKHGGMIRWNDDKITAESDDPFMDNAVTCDLVNPCQRINLIPKTSGQIIGDATNSNIEIANPSENDAYSVSFRNLSNDPDCSSSRIDNFRIWIKDSAGNFMDNGGGLDGREVNFTRANWSEDNISLEKGQKIVFSQFGTPSLNCGKGIAVKFSKYKDIKIQQSGLVSFKMLGEGSGSCRLKGRIINPKGSHSNETFGSEGIIDGYSADFYEHDNFLSDPSTDPLRNLVVRNADWTRSFFVRKGQVLRFAPTSWNGNWNPTGLTAKCGVGMAMSISPRPALLCRGKSSDLISNPSCTGEYQTINGVNTLIGCQAVSQECSDETSGKFCPLPNCQKNVTCTTSIGLAPSYSKSGCSATGTITTSCPSGDTSCQARLCSYNSITAPFITSGTCSACDNARAANAMQPAKISLPDSDQCYDLENYEGKIENINIATGFLDDELADPNKSKGAKKLTTFSGSYGNLESFNQVSEKDAETGNQIFKLSSPVIFTQAGRLKFFLLDGNSFNGPVSSPDTGGVLNAYDNNSDEGSGYASDNGVKISSSGMLSFNNGQWMEIRLCKESSDTSADCRQFSVNSLDGQPHIIDITPPTTPAESSSNPLINSPYKFDSSGNLVRTGSLLDIDCENSLPNSYFYCHKYKYFSKSDLADKSENEQKDINAEISKLRLSFKIIDPEIFNCSKSNPTSTNAADFDGVILNNSYYAPPSSENAGDPNYVNVGKICGANEIPGADDTSCRKQFYCAGKYVNNSGSYFVNVKVKNSVPNTVSSLIGGVIKPIIQVMDGDGLLRDCSSTGSSNLSDFDGVKTRNPQYNDKDPSMRDQVCLINDENCEKQYYCRIANSVGQAERIYRSLISDSRYKAIVTMCITVMFTFYGVGFLMGVSELNHSEIINRVIKIGLIYLFTGEVGWEWFDKIVVGFFKRSTDELAFLMASSFDDSAELKSVMTSGNYYDKSILFSSVDNVFNMFFSPAVQKKASALLFASIFGWLYMLIIYWGFMLYVGAVANAVLLYLTAQVFISILFTLGPIFFIFTLFSQTKEMFDNWLKQLISFSLQQIFLLTTLAFFNMLMYEVIKLSLGYKICWAEVWSINIFMHISLMSFWTISSLPPRTNAQSSVGNIGNPEGIPSLFSILFIYVIASLMNQFVTFMTNVAASIGGGLKASELGSGIKEAVQAAGSAIKSQAKSGVHEMLVRVGGDNLLSKLDDKLFDSGAIADKRRQDAKAKNDKMSGDKTALEKAGDAAVSDFKKNHGAELAAMPDQAAKLAEVRNNAMNAEGAKRGLDARAIAETKAFKSSYKGNNAFAASIHFARTARQKSINEQNVNTSFSASEWKQAMKNTDDAGRAKMIEARKSGSLKVGRSTSGKALKAASDLSNSTPARMAGDLVRGAGSLGYQTVKAAVNLSTSPEARQKAADQTVKSTGKAMRSAYDAGAAVSTAASEAKNAAWEGVKSAGSGVKSLATSQEARRNAASATKQAFVYGAKATGKGLYAGVSAAARAPSYLNEARKSEDHKNREEAERQLIDEIAIDQMSAGTSWAADDRNKAIKEKAELNKAQRAVNIKKPNAQSIADMEMEREYLAEKDAIDGNAPLLEQLSSTVGALGRRINPNSSNKKSKINAAKMKAHRIMRSKVATDLQNAGTEYDISQQDLKASTERFTAAADAFNQHPEAKAIKKAQDKVKNAGSKSEKKAAEKLLKALERTKSPELRKLEKARQSAYGSQLKAATKSRNIKSRMDKLESIGESMDQAQATTERALNAVEPLEHDADSSSPAPETKAQEKFSELRTRAEETTERARANRNEYLTENSRKTGVKKAVDSLVNGRSTGVKLRVAEKELAKFDSDRGKKVYTTANSIVENAQSVLHAESANRESREYKDAEATVRSFDKVDSFDGLESFVEDQQKRAEQLFDNFGDLQSPEDFDKFNSKNSPAKRLGDD
jgi:type IV secretory pathway VirB6-like protein